MESPTSTPELMNYEGATSSINKEEIESVDAIKRFIEKQEKEIKELQSARNTPTTEKTNDDSMDSKLSQSETISVASSVIDMIISESELELSRRKDMKSKIMSPEDKGIINLLSVIDMHCHKYLQ